MKKILLVILLGITFFICLISGIAVPVMALTYHDIYKDFRDYEVTDFISTPIVLNSDTFNMNVYGNVYYQFNYKMDSCPSGIVNKRIALITQYYDKLGTLIFNNGYEFDIPCVTSYTTYTKTLTYVLPSNAAASIKDVLTLPNDNFIRISNRFYDDYNAADYSGITINLRNLQIENRFFYDFNTTYYFDKLAVDGNAEYFSGFNVTISSGGVTPGNSNIFLLVAYDSTDYYRLWNSDTSYSITRGRKKYVVPLDDHITAYGIGVGTYAVAEYDSAYYTKIVGNTNRITFSSYIYLLNYANTQQAFPGATTIPDWTYDTCAAWDIPCHLGNALVYLATDAPITSSIYSVVSNAWEVIANGLYAFSSIFGAEFDSGGNLIGGNIIGILIVVSLGILIITWGGEFR